MSKFKTDPINKGAIFTNDKKNNEKAPDKIGKFVDEHGEIKNIAIWQNISKNGLKYESFIISNYISSFVPKPDTNGEINDNINEMPF